MFVSDVEQARYYVVQFEDGSFYTDCFLFSFKESEANKYITVDIHRAKKYIFDWNVLKDENLKFASGLLNMRYRIVPVRAKIEYEIIEE